MTDELINQINEVFDAGVNILGVDEVYEYMKTHKGPMSFGQFIVNTELINAFKPALETKLLEKYEQTLIELNNFLPFVVEYLMSETPDEMAEGSERVPNTRRWVGSVRRLYKEWEENHYKPTLSAYLGDKQLFSNVDSKVYEKFDPIYMNIVDEVIKSGQFRFYRFRGTETLPTNFQFRIATKIGLSEHVSDWLDYVNTYEYNEGEVLVTLFGRCDDTTPNFSYFVITLHYKGSIWLATDQFFFNNPQNKQSQAARGRSAERKMDKKLESIDLPYHLFFELDEVRESQTGVLRGQQTMKYEYPYEFGGYLPADLDKEFEESKYVKLDDTHKKQLFLCEYYGKQALTTHNLTYTSTKILNRRSFSNWAEGLEFKHEGRIVAIAKIESNKIVITIPTTSDVLIVGTETIPETSRFYLIILIEKLIESIYHTPADQIESIMTAATYVDQKLLENKTFNPLETESETGEFDEFIGYENKNQHYFNEITESVTDIPAQTKAVALKTYEVVKISHNFDRNWLGTPKALETLSRWLVLDNEAKVVKETVISKIKASKGDSFNEMKRALTSNLDRLMSYCFSEPKMFIGEVVSFGGMFGSEKDGNSTVYFGSQKFINGNIFSNHHIGYTQKHYPGKGFGGYCQCDGCTSQKTFLKNSAVSIRIYHYSQLMMLLGLKDRMELPQYYRNYRHCSLVPYHGNTLLDNVHPYATVEDPLSDDAPNGIYIYIYMCARCLQRYKKKWKNNELPVIDFEAYDMPNTKIKATENEKE